jgi:hypothetical protein
MYVGVTSIMCAYVVLFGSVHLIILCTHKCIQQLYCYLLNCPSTLLENIRLYYIFITPDKRIKHYVHLLIFVFLLQEGILQK